MDAKMKRLVSLLIACVVTISCAKAQYTLQSLEETWSFALKNNPDNSIYQLRTEKATKDHETAKSYLYPKASLGLSWQYNRAIPATPVPGEILGMPNETVYLEFGQTYNYNAGLVLSKNLFDWQARFQAKIAESNISLVRAEQALFDQNLRQNVAQVYYAALTAQVAIDLSQKDLTLADSILLLSTEKFQQGLIDMLTLNQAKISKNNARDRLEKNKQYLFENETNLKMLLGLNPSDTVVLSEKIQLNVNSAVEMIATDELNLNLYKIQTENADLVTKQAMFRFLPKLELVTYLGGIQYQENFDFSLKADDWQTSRYIGLNLSVPLFTGFATKNQYLSAQVSENIAQLNYDEAKRKSSLNDGILFNNYVAAKYSLQTAQQNLELADANVQIAYSKYSEGLISIDHYLSVYDDYLAVESQYFSQLSDYLINEAIILSRNK
jgi:outer membrane protein